MSVLINNETYYRTADVCRMVGISRNTLFRWIKVGVIKNETRDWRGWRLFTQSQVEQLKAITGNSKFVETSINHQDMKKSRLSMH
jgi:DNA-binding transcriptional MerR regulator